MTPKHSARRKPVGIFAPAADWWHNACLNYLPDQLCAYADGYKEAADAVVEHALEHQYHLDTFVYPILFLYRHHLELRLKELIQNGGFLLGRRTKVPRDHRLDNLWAPCRRILEKAWPESRAELKSIDRCIREFSRVDPSSEAFRYSRTKCGKKTLEGITHVNLRYVRDVMAEVTGLLNGASIGIAEYRRGPF
jgi:hypothetical protein